MEYRMLQYYSGYSGISGWSGQSGWSGWSSWSGWSGQSGWSGLPGYATDSGWSGWSGQSGAVGPSGPSGPSGPQGASGDFVASGFSGWSGWSGTPGMNGYNEIYSYQASKGSGHSVWPTVTNHPLNSVSMASGVLYTYPQLVAKEFVVGSFKVCVDSLYTNPTNILIGIYDDNNGYPGNLVAQTVEGNLTSTGVATISMSAPFALLPNRIYWIVITAEYNLYMVGFNAYDLPPVLDVDDASFVGLKHISGYSYAGSYSGSLLASFPVSATKVLSNGSFPMCVVIIQ